MHWNNLAVVIREGEDDTILLEIARLCGKGRMHESCWESLITTLFAPDSQGETDCKLAMARLAELGIDEAAKTELAERTWTKSSLLFVIVGRPIIRDQVLGVLRGFQGEITVTRLKGEQRKT